METKIQNSIDEIKEIYLTDNKPLYVAYSGGKDSTVVLDIVVKAIKQIEAHKRDKEVFVLFSDTLLEMPPVIDQIKDSIRSFKNYCGKEDLPIVFKQVEPELYNTFWSKLIGIGYTLPRRDYRWCTDRMKITPMQKAVKEIVDRYEGYIAVTGARKDESEDRRKRLEKNAIDGYLHLKKHSEPNCKLLAPIEDFTTKEVWEYIYYKTESWVKKESLGTIYSSAAGDDEECTTILEGGELGNNPGCSKSARFGCMICPLFEKDKTLNNLSEEHAYLSIIEEFRNWLVQFRDGHWDKRDVYNHRDFRKIEYNKDNHRKGMVSPGGYTLEFRIEILKRLLKMQDEVRAVKPDFQIITKEELEFIQDRWLKEGDLNLSAVELAAHSGIEVSYDTDLHKKIKLLAALQKIEDASMYGTLSYYSSQYHNNRYYAQLVCQLDEMAGNAEEYVYALSGLSETISQQEAVELVLTLPVETKQYYPTPDIEKIRRKEWERDEINIVTVENLIARREITAPDQRNLFGYEGEWAEEFNKIESLQDNDYNWEEDPNLSFDDKIAILEDAIDFRRKEIKAERRICGGFSL